MVNRALVDALRQITLAFIPLFPPYLRSKPMTDFTDQDRARLTDLLDEAAVRAGVTRYTYAVDWMNWPLLESLFWPDATIDFGDVFRGDRTAFMPFVIARSRKDTRGACTCSPERESPFTVMRPKPKQARSPISEASAATAASTMWSGAVTSGSWRSVTANGASPSSITCSTISSAPKARTPTKGR